MAPTTTFRERSQIAVRNSKLQRAVRNATSRFLNERAEAVSELPNWESMRERASRIKEDTLSRLDEVLDEFTRNATRAGVRVARVKNAEETFEYVSAVARRIGAKLAVKGKSMVSEEIELNHFLSDNGVKAAETDLGEWIVQLAGESPSHIIAPAIHKSREDVRELFQAVLGEGANAEISELTLIARRRLRAIFLEADLGFSGANFLVAETGSIVLVENEGNIRFSTTLPRAHIAIAGIEKIIPRESDLALFLPLLIRSGTGQKLSSYVSVITGPRREGDLDGPEEVHVLLLDNGRRAILENERMRPTLKCIRCAACLNTCPVYQSTGGHAYASAYSGPIGAVLTPQLRGFECAGDLPLASSLCGACADICPVKVPLTHLLLDLRSEASRVRSSAGASRVKKLLFRLWAEVMRRPWVYDLAGFAMRSALKRPLVLSQLSPAFREWMKIRGTITPPGKSFRSQWERIETAQDASGFNPRRELELPIRKSFSNLDAFSSSADSQTAMQPGASDPRKLISKFVEELAKAGGRCEVAGTMEDLRSKLATLIRDKGASRVAAASSVFAFDHRLSDSIESECGITVMKLGTDSGIESLSSAQIGITGVFAALADSGSLLLRHSSDNPRTCSLLPEVHVALMNAAQIVSSLPDALLMAEQSGSFSSRACWTFVTGPSRTGDIELKLTIGVHGPKELHVFVLDDGLQAGDR